MHILVEARVDGCHSEAKRNLNFPVFPRATDGSSLCSTFNFPCGNTQPSSALVVTTTSTTTTSTTTTKTVRDSTANKKITLIARLASPAPNLATSLLLSVLWCKPITLAFTMSWVIINILFFRAIYFYPPLMSSFSWSYLESDPSSGRHGNWTRLPNRSTSTLTSHHKLHCQWREFVLCAISISLLGLFGDVVFLCHFVPFRSDHLGSVPFCAIWKNWGLSFFVPFDFGVVRHSCYYEYDINHHYS